jgi:hypothetical protein
LLSMWNKIGFMWSRAVELRCNLLSVIDHVGHFTIAGIFIFEEDTVDIYQRELFMVTYIMLEVDVL